jgi:hypothetical protein
MAWGPGFSGDIVEGFRIFCEGYYIDPSEDGIDELTLGNYIGAWLADDPESAIRTTGRDFTAWLEAVIILIDAYEKDPSIIDYKGNELWENNPNHERAHPPQERRVTRMLDLKEWGAAFLDSHKYRGIAAGDH